MTQKPRSLSSRGLGKLGLCGIQELSVKAIDHGPDLCRVKGRTMALGGAIVRLE